MMKIELTKEAQAMLDRPLDEKIAFISKESWIDYPLSQIILDQLEEIFVQEKNKLRIASFLLIGSSNNGKTSLLHKFLDMHPPYDFFQDNPEKITKEFFDKYEATGTPIKYILAPSEPSETRLYSNILNSINAPFKESDAVAKKQYLVEYYLKLLNVEMLIIDEIHNILSGSVAKQKQILNAIKNLSNNLKIPIVLAGTKDALRAISTDPQIISRFRPIYLTKWKMEKDYVNLLATIISTLPLKKESDILNAKTAQEILRLSDGCIGDIVALLKKAAIYALQRELERITLDEIQKCGHVSMSHVHKTINLQDL